ncbi:MAG: NAD(P)-binding domain-containing protein [Bacteroidales bacterium]|nr:NAD(P)-binding domain-containing protein [Bacteroidales bacterium]MCF8351934.1 NAD(P)-binding domain-containing protein [Bacteroidales bacterium]MCF8374885.1 NAD(P)-binding domain-containing protein [Bacteroidales bacterium]MCF8400136.1 NAD(P)-binding domain-containing protein [Bacteroidales bacterium]
MDFLLNETVIYVATILLCLLVIALYLYLQARKSRITKQKIQTAKEEGLYEPVSLHPVVDKNSCIKTGACIVACPEKDILGIVNGKAATINASRCVGHGACFHACPTEAITLCIGTEQRGVELPHVNKNFETNIPGIFIAGELGGMGLIRNAVEQGKQAVENIAKSLKKNGQAEYDLIIVGAGPAGIAASLTAKKLKLKSLTLDQESLGGTVYTFPRAKVVMTSAMDLPLHGKVKLTETTKPELLELWNEVLSKNEIQMREGVKIESIISENGHFKLIDQEGVEYSARRVLLAIGRRGSPRKLNVPGENSQKVAYRLLEPELIKDKKVVVVGGGDSAIESALLLAGQNDVILSYRKDAFSRLKPKNKNKIEDAMQENSLKVIFNSNLKAIKEKEVEIEIEGETEIIENDLVYIFAGGVLPTKFLEKAGIKITKKFGEAILKH